MTDLLNKLGHDSRTANIRLHLVNLFLHTCGCCSVDTITLLVHGLCD